MSGKASVFRGFLVAALAATACGCGAGFGLTKQGATLQEFLDDQAACKAVVGKTSAQQPVAAKPPTSSAPAPAQAAAQAPAATPAPPANPTPSPNPAPAAAQQPKTNTLGLRVMDPQVYNCMLSKGWHPPG